MAEVIFKNLCGRGVTVKSAGTHAAKALGFMTKESGEALKICGEKLPRKKIKATQFEQEMIAEFDYVICMTWRHKERVGEAENVKTLDELVGSGDIFDPFGHPLDTYIEVCKKLQKELGLLYTVLVKLRGA
jgi:protein-tyrosine-phosphatase